MINYFFPLYITNRTYYMYCIIGIDALLSDINKFLKNKWFDSAFIGHQVQFSSMNYIEFNAKTKLSAISSKKILYQFDMETTTEVIIDKIQIDEKRKIHERTEQYLKNIESIGQLVGEVL